MRIRLPEGLAAEVQGYRWTRDPLGRSGANVYRLHDGRRPDLYLKQAGGSVADDITDEFARLTWLGRHLPAPRVRTFLRTSEEAWLLTEALPGRTAYQEMPQDPGGVVDAVADHLRRLHAIDVAECPFVGDHAFRLRKGRARIDAGLVDTEDFDDERQGWSAERVWQELTAALPIAAEPVVAHGDYSLDNVLLSNGVVTGVIDVGALGVADRYQDLAIAWRDLGEFGPEAQSRFLERYGVTEPDQHRLSFHNLLDELF